MRLTPLPYGVDDSEIYVGTNNDGEGNLNTTAIKSYFKINVYVVLSKEPFYS